MDDGPALALVFDDGYATDYEEVRPVLAEAGVPACLAIVPEWLGDPDHLDADRLAELADEGWEVVAHGRKHRYLQAHRLTSDVSSGETRIPVEGHVFPGEDHGVAVGDDLELVDGSGREHVRVSGTSEGEDGDPVIEVEEPIEGSFAADESVVRPTESLLRDEIVGVREEFADLGYDPSSFVFPYDAADPRAWSVAAEHYDVIPDAAIKSLPNPPGTPGTNLRRYYLETTHMTMAEIETYLDAVAEQGGLGILAGHTDWDSVPPERVESVVEKAQSRGIGVATLRDLCD